MGPAEKRQRRTERRARANAKASVVVDRTAVRDPLLRPARTRRVWVIALLGCLSASIVLHAAVVVAASLLPAARVHVANAPLRIQVLAAPESVPLPTETAPPPPEPPPRLPVPTLEARHPPEPIRPVVDSPPPPDPTSEPPPVVADPAPTSTQRRRVVGLGLESTTLAGAGPAFAAGNTRMGQTDGVAQDPASLGGRAGRTFTPPRRKSEPVPRYPASLREREVEGDVGVEAAIDATGAVTRISVVRPSPHPEFDRAAADAAGLGSYEPARLDGVAVANVITFTVRFRLHPSRDR